MPLVLTNYFVENDNFSRNRENNWVDNFHKIPGKQLFLNAWIISIPFALSLQKTRDSIYHVWPLLGLYKAQMSAYSGVLHRYLQILFLFENKYIRIHLLNHRILSLLCISVYKSSKLCNSPKNVCISLFLHPSLTKSTQNYSCILKLQLRSISGKQHLEITKQF